MACSGNVGSSPQEWGAAPLTVRQAEAGDGDLLSSVYPVRSDHTLDLSQSSPSQPWKRAGVFLSRVQLRRWRCLTEPPLGSQEKACSLNDATIPGNASRLPSGRQEAVLRRV